MPKIKFSVSTGFVGSKRTGEIEIDDEEWAEMDEEAREELANELYEEWLCGVIDGGWDIEE